MYRVLPLNYRPKTLNSNGAGGIRTHDLGVIDHVVPSAFVMPCSKSNARSQAKTSTPTCDFCFKKDPQQGFARRSKSRARFELATTAPGTEVAESRSLTNANVVLQAFADLFHV